MFCDLVESTSMARSFDAEDLAHARHTYLDEASAAVIGLAAMC